MPRDLLQRHYTVHGRDANNQEGLPPNAGIIPKSAGRTPIACSNCAKTKTKCDKKFPCSRCAQRNLKCTLRPTRRASKNVNRVAPPGENGTGGSSESGNNESQNNSGSNSPAKEDPSATKSQPQQAVNVQVQPQQLMAGQPPPPPPSQPPSVTHSRNPSVSQPIQQLQTSSPADEKPLHIPISTNTPPFFEQSPSVPSSLPTILSPLPTPAHGFISQTPMSGYEDFVGTVQDHTDDTNPRFMMDAWNPMAFGHDLEPMRMDPSLMMSMNMDMDMDIGPAADGLLSIIPEMSPPQTFAMVQTPIQTPRMDESFSDLQIGSSASMFYPSNRQNSTNEAGIPEMGAIIAAQDGWSVFRCTPAISSTSCPRTARLNLEHLEQSLKSPEVWSNWTPPWDETDFQPSGRVEVAKLHEATRDRLLAITQGFMQKALDIHRNDMSSSSSNGGSPGSTASNFLLLPPAHVLDLFLRAYANSFERYYPTTSGGVLDANGLMHIHQDVKAPCLLVLMMISQGATTIPTMEARWLTGGLTEVCRISLFDLVEKDIIMAGDATVLRAALLFTVQAAWSGDKWQMDIAMGQRGMYFAMLRHSGLLEYRPSTIHVTTNTPDSLWKDWIAHESRSR